MGALESRASARIPIRSVLRRASKYKMGLVRLQQALALAWAARYSTRMRRLVRPCAGIVDGLSRRFTRG